MALRSMGMPDPFILGEFTRPDTWKNNYGYTDLSGKTLRLNAIDPAKKTLVLITAGQSNMASHSATTYSVTNSTVIDNFNIYDGAMYTTSDPLLGTSYTNGSGPGGITNRLADKFVTNAIFDRVIMVPTAIAGSPISAWVAGGPLNDRLPVAVRRLAARGITPSTTGVTFALVWLQGESDNGVTSQATYSAALAFLFAKATAAGFSGRIFVCKVSLISGAVDANIQAAQTGIVDGVTYFSGGDIDSLTGLTNREADLTHLNGATGIPAAATLIYNAIHASGAPF